MILTLNNAELTTIGHLSKKYFLLDGVFSAYSYIPADWNQDVYCWYDQIIIESIWGNLFGPIETYRQ